jgi:magnesium-transporting ATPase (P-type)
VTRSTSNPEPSMPPAAVPPSGRPTWHALPTADVVQELATTYQGLTSVQAGERLSRHGPNSLPRPRGDGPLVLVWRQVNSPLVWVLVGSAMVAWLADPVDGVKNGVVIAGVVVLNTVIGFVQEYRAGKAIEALSRMVPVQITGVRDGRALTLAAVDLVPGDVVQLASGDKVPADARLLLVKGLTVDESALTGESVPAEKREAPVAADAQVGDRTSMVFGGTLVTQGTATAVVVETGATTQLGRISQLLTETTHLETPLTRSLGRLGAQITWAILAVALGMTVLGVARTMNDTGVTVAVATREMIIFAIALAVGAIPEGLPAIVTIALAIGVQRMATRNAVVRKLPAVETLGSTTVICSDKTGTLTRNEMTVQALWTPTEGHLDVTGVGYAPLGELLAGGAPLVPLPPGPRDVLIAGALCSDATLIDGSTVNGDPTEAALVVAAAKAGIEAGALRAEHPRLDVVPFESQHQFMATLHAVSSGPFGAREPASVAVMKGAPEVVLERCAHTAGGGPVDRARALAQVEELAAKGMRVLAFAARRFPAERRELSAEEVAGDFEFLGLQGMIDPPRQEAVEAVARCHAAGITVKMITGDHHGTAEAIGRSLGLLPPGAGRAITGAELGRMDDDALRAAAGQTHVFARVSPEHKLRLVRALQSRGEVVAMTGDGVNDAPALKQADIGVAMGITGTSVSKEAAAIVLTDDNFATIATAVEEGRRVYDNLVKSLAFVLPTNLGLALVLAVAVAAFPFGEVTRLVDGVAVTTRELLVPMLPTQLLWINLVATVALALPLAFEAAERDVMARPPRTSGAPVLDRFLVIRTFVAATLMCAGAVGLFLYEYGRELPLVGTADHPFLTRETVVAEAQTIAVTAVIAFQIFYMITCRSLRGSLLALGWFGNPMTFVGIAVVAALQLAFIYAPPLQALFGSASLQPFDLLRAVAVGAIVLPVIAFEKWHRGYR